MAGWAEPSGNSWTIATGTKQISKANASTPSILESGMCGDDAEYVVYDDGTCVISGTGAFELTFGMFNWGETKRIKILEGITEIKDASIGFGGMEYIESIELPSTLKRIGNGIFSHYYSSLRSIFIPENVEFIGNDVFMNCANLASIKIDERNTHYSSGENGNVIYDLAQKKVIRGLSNSIIPNDALIIGENCFFGCNTLQTITLPNSIEKICSGAFYHCNNLSEIKFPESLRVIEDGAFEWIDNLKELYIPSSVDSIGNAFSWCKQLCSIKVADSNKVYDSRNNCNAIIRSKDNTLIVGCGNTVIPNTIEKIGVRAFAGRKNLTSISIPNSVLRIEGEVFYDCENLSEVILPEDLISIGTSAFMGCSFKNIALPPYIEEIGYGAFAYNTNLESIYIPRYVNSIGDGLTSGCSSLKSIIVDPDNRDYDSRNNCNALIRTETNTLISGCYNTQILEGIKMIEQEAFRDCLGLTSITIPNSIRKIGWWSFAYCDNIKDIYCYKLDPNDEVLPTGFEIDRRKTLHVIKGMTSVFEKADGWYRFRIVDDLELTDAGDSDISDLNNAIYTDSYELHAGDSVVLSVKMKNSGEVSGLQTNIYLPEEMDVVKVARRERLKDRDEDDEYIFEFENTVYEDGSYFLLAYTSQNATIGDYDGEIATITLNIPKTIKPGDYPILIKNTELSKDGSSATAGCFKSTLRILDYTLGDTNGDNKKSVADLTCIASYLLGNTPDNFVPKAADVNGDGKISVSDITALAKMLLNGNHARVRTLFVESVE